jgi:hypothetical protein
MAHLAGLYLGYTPDKLAEMIASIEQTALQILRDGEGVVQPTPPGWRWVIEELPRERSTRRPISKWWREAAVSSRSSQGD